MGNRSCSRVQETAFGYRRLWWEVIGGEEETGPGDEGSGSQPYGVVGLTHRKTIQDRPGLDKELAFWVGRLGWGFESGV